MNCPRCGSNNLKPVSVHSQNFKRRCEECGFVTHPNDYEFDYELFHPGVCGRCKQTKPNDSKTKFNYTTRN